MALNFSGNKVMALRLSAAQANRNPTSKHPQHTNMFPKILTQANKGVPF